MFLTSSPFMPREHSLAQAGIYTDVGPQTCAGYVGSFGHEAQDAATFAAWGLDFVEEDSCHHPAYPNGTLIPYRDLYARMRDGLNATGRPIVFYACVQGQDAVQTWGPATANLWRTTGDICAPGKASWASMLRNFYDNAQYPNVTGPGQWQVRSAWKSAGSQASEGAKRVWGVHAFICLQYRRSFLDCLSQPRSGFIGLSAFSPLRLYLCTVCMLTSLILSFSQSLSLPLLLLSIPLARCSFLYSSRISRTQASLCEHLL